MLDAVESFTHLLSGTATGSLVCALAEVSAGGDSAPGGLTTLSGGLALSTVAAYLVLAGGFAVVLIRRRDVA